MDFEHARLAIRTFAFIERNDSVISITLLITVLYLRGDSEIYELLILLLLAMTYRDERHVSRFTLPSCMCIQDGRITIPLKFH